MDAAARHPYQYCAQFQLNETPSFTPYPDDFAELPGYSAGWGHLVCPYFARFGSIRRFLYADHRGD
jgi:hypothetical protein